MDKVRFAVVGIKGMGIGHVRTAAKTEEVELVAVCDIDEDAVKKCAEEYNVEHFVDYKELHRSGKVDAIATATPHFLHAPVAIDALNQGIHVLVEKPLSCTVEDGDAMIAAAKKNNVKLAVGHSARPGARGLRGAIESGMIGDIMRVLWCSNDLRTMGYYNSGAWRGTWAMEGGGVLINQTIHDMDTLQYLVGPVKEVVAMVANIAHDIEVEDIAGASLRFENGAFGVFHVSLTNIPGLSRREIVGDRGTIIMGDGGNRFARLSASVKEYIAGVGEEPKVTWEDTLPSAEPSGPPWGGSMVRDLAMAILEDRSPFVSGESALKAIEMMNAIVLSHFKKRPVTIPLDRKEYTVLIKDLSEGKYGNLRVKG